MTVFAISRDYGINPQIVRLVVNDSIENIVQPGWLGSIMPEIAVINNGEFSWQTSDAILIQYNQTNDPTFTGPNAIGLFYVFSNFLSVNPLATIYPNLQNVTAHAGGGQTNATQINVGINIVVACASNGDSVKLPDDVLGQSCIVVNITANSCNVFPFLGDSIDNLGLNNPFSLAAHTSKLFIGGSTNAWYGV